MPPADAPVPTGRTESQGLGKRRELLDHAIILDDRHLRRLLNEYLAYYHEDRTHLGVDKDAPLTRTVEPCRDGAATVHARPRVGGLHHRYSWDAAA